MRANMQTHTVARGAGVGLRPNSGGPLVRVIGMARRRRLVARPRCAWFSGKGDMRAESRMLAGRTSSLLSLVSPRRWQKVFPTRRAVTKHCEKSA